MLECAICMEEMPPARAVETCRYGHTVCTACLEIHTIRQEGVPCIICQPHARLPPDPPPDPPPPEPEEIREAFLPDDEPQGCVRWMAVEFGLFGNLIMLAAGAALFKGAAYLATRGHAPAWARFDDSHVVHWFWQGLVVVLALAGLESAVRSA